MPLRTKYDAPTAAIATASLILGLVTSYLDGTGIFKVVKPTILISTIIAYALLLVFYSLILKGYQWARILFVILFLLGIASFAIVFFAFTFKKSIVISMSTPLSTASFLVQWLLNFIATLFAGLGIKEYPKLVRNINR